MWVLVKTLNTYQEYFASEFDGDVDKTFKIMSEQAKINCINIEMIDIFNSLVDICNWAETNKTVVSCSAPSNY